MDNRDIPCVKLADAKEASSAIDSLIRQYRAIDRGLTIRIEELTKELAELKQEQERLRKFIPKNVPVKN